MYWVYGLTSIASLALCVGALPSKIQKRDWIVGQEVKTSSGTVKGHAGQFRKEVSEYVGIPYAKPPIGALRFAPPVKFTGTGSINASVYVSYMLKLKFIRTNDCSLRKCALNCVIVQTNDVLTSQLVTAQRPSKILLCRRA
jgi:hypothetical protein